MLQELSLAIDKSTVEANQKHKILETEHTRTKAVQVRRLYPTCLLSVRVIYYCGGERFIHQVCFCKQVGLEKTLESLRKAHAERQVLIRQWESTIEQMRKRDHDLQQCIMVTTGGAREPTF